MKKELTYEDTGETYEIKSRGWIVHAVKLTCPASWEDLTGLIGTEFKGKKILAVERFAIPDQSYAPIGLAVMKE